jgi:hypothetical protein
MDVNLKVGPSGRISATYVLTSQTIQPPTSSSACGQPVTSFCGVSFSADQREAKALESELKRLKEKSTDVLSVDTFSVSY